MSGYVRLHRSLLGHPAFRNESEAMAFAWLVARAAWKPTRVRYKGHGISLKRGQLAISQRDMAREFDRDKAWIERLWKRLRDEAMVTVSSEAGVAVITICKYAEYQADADDREAPREASNEADARQARGTEQEREKGKKENSDARGTRLPDDFEMPMHWISWAIKKRGWSRGDAIEESGCFIRYWQAKAGRDALKRDWFKTWQNWAVNSRRAGSADEPVWDGVA